MNDVLLAALLAAVLCGLGGLAVPVLIGRVPEPEPEPEPERPADEADGDAVTDAVTDAEPPKEPYAAIAALPRLGVGSALASAGIGGLLGATTGLDWSLLWLVPLVPVFVALSVIDVRTRLLPRLVVWPATVVTLVLVVAVGLATDQRGALVEALLGMVFAFVFFFVLWFVYPIGIGYGDVRLAGVVGLVLGWVGLGALMIGMWVGFAAFGLPGLVLAVVRRDRALMKKAFPFGPFMLVGTVVGLAWGTAIAGSIWG